MLCRIYCQRGCEQVFKCILPGSCCRRALSGRSLSLLHIAFQCDLHTLRGTGVLLLVPKQNKLPSARLAAILVVKLKGAKGV